MPRETRPRFLERKLRKELSGVLRGGVPQVFARRAGRSASSSFGSFLSRKEQKKGGTGVKCFSVAIDGPAGAGKSTMAKRVAEALGFLYVDTGAIYRTVGLAARRAGVEDSAGTAALLPGLKVALDYGADGLQHMYLNGEDVTAEIRRPEISLYASRVSAIPEVRSFLLQKQRDLAATRNVVMDGRDIGTVVLPNADVKIFLTAAPEERARRRHAELLERGMDSTYENVLADLTERDQNDMNRPVAPLRRAEDAVQVDTTGISLEDSFTLLLDTIQRRIAL
ncbi:MAG: (d)CMP kinase [Oscillospiraceae bacterium]|nr:(d)CMP kinase [Oscillospiraceae bacterium]